MSHTPSVGVVGPSHWTYVASVMADGLREIVSSRAVRETLPEGILGAAEEFFSLALESAAGRVTKNPPASMANFLIASEALSTPQTQLDRPSAKARQLRTYRSFIGRLRRRGRLTPSEIEQAGELQKFFARLREAGESEAYEARVAFAAPPTTLRMR